MGDLRDFEDAGPSLEEEVEAILQHPDWLTKSQLVDLAAVLAHYMQESGADLAGFDLKSEIEAQIAMVKALRNTIVTPGGRMKDGTQPREAKEVIGASTTLLSTLMKFQDKIQSFERQRAIELAVTQAAKQLPEDAQAAFFADLEARLEAIE